MPDPAPTAVQFHEPARSDSDAKEQFDRGDNKRVTPHPGDLKKMRETAHQAAQQRQLQEEQRQEEEAEAATESTAMLGNVIDETENAAVAAQPKDEDDLQPLIIEDTETIDAESTQRNSVKFHETSPVEAVESRLK